MQAQSCTLQAPSCYLLGALLQTQPRTPDVMCKDVLGTGTHAGRLQQTIWWLWRCARVSALFLNPRFGMWNAGLAQVVNFKKWSRQRRRAAERVHASASQLDVHTPPSW